MPLSRALSVILCLLSTPLTQAGQLLQTTETWNGESIVYPQGEAQVTSFKLSIDEGETTPFHCHPVPTLGYILSGTVEVELQNGKKSIFRAGESVVEVLRTVHRGKAIDGPVEIIVFYAGATDLPNTVMPEDDAKHRYCDA